tara:strand:- start:993 stop:1418 length:426 start_codon:yes stop_codon:yes gene_type:complete
MRKELFKIHTNHNRNRAYLIEYKTKHYTDNFHPYMMKFVNMYYDLYPYSNLINKFKNLQKTFEEPTDFRHILCRYHINHFLNTNMVWPEENNRTMLVKDLPKDEIEKMIDYLGYCIGLSRINAAESLISIYHMYKYIEGWK